jgi:hypothetical protein
VLGQLNKHALIRRVSFDVGGFASAFRCDYDRLTGASYRLYRGQFLALYDGQIFRAPRLILPPAADAWLANQIADSEQDKWLSFALRIQIVAAKTHTIGYDWRFDVLDAEALLKRGE